MPRILIVDSDAEMLELLRAILEREGFEAITTFRASTIFKLIHSFKPDVILIDMHMGQFDVASICREIKIHPDISNINIILMSDLHTNIDAAKYYCDDFISKPINMADLVDKLLTAH